MKKFRTKIPDLEFFLYGIHLFGGICDKLTWELVEYIGKIHELPEHAIHMSRCKVSGCEFSTKSDEWFSS